MIFLLTFQGIIYYWDVLTHILNCSYLLDMVHIPHYAFLLRAIYVQIVSFTSPKFDSLLFPFPQGLYHIRSTLRWLDLLICIRIVLEERRFISLLPMILLVLFLISPRLMKICSAFALAIQVVGLLDCQYKSLRFIKLNFYLYRMETTKL
jgi:hypothetical protein